jgi:dTDP-glucose pyrophosphorylase
MSREGDVRKAVLLAAGRGTRLGSLTADRPKPLLTIGRRPLIAHILDGLLAIGIEGVIVITGYRAAMIEAELGNGAGSGISITYVHQQQLNGTARALALARDHMGEERFFFTWADILVEPRDYAAVLKGSRLADGAIAVNPVDDPAEGAAVFTDPPLPWPPAHESPAAYVTRIIEKPPPGSSDSHWNNAGFGVLAPAIWDAIEHLQPSPRGEYELPAAIDAIVQAGQRIRAIPVNGPWFDIGTPEALEAARAAFDTHSLQ